MTKLIVASDLHIPEHDEAALNELLKRIRSLHPDVLVLNGDLVDSASISHFSKSPDTVSLKHEIEVFKSVLKQIKSAVGRGKIEYLAGNHEARLDKVMWDIPGLFGMNELTFPSLLGIDPSHWKAYNKDTFLRIGPLTFHHGSDVRKNTELTAKDRLTRTKSKILFTGHTHKLSVQYIEDRAGIACAVETGCLQDINKVKYMKSIPVWQQGWVEVTLDGDSFPRIQPVFLAA